MARRGQEKAMGICLENVREKAPLIHNITNYVTVNDVANMVLACGAAPMMSDEPSDIEELTSLCAGLNINIGTLNMRRLKGMLLAGRKARELRHAIVLDPVGAGASHLRTQTALRLVEECRPDAVKGNISEIKALMGRFELSGGSASDKPTMGGIEPVGDFGMDEISAGRAGESRGVDVAGADAVTEENLESAVAYVKRAAARIGAVVAVSGAIDLVSDGKICYVIRNGRPQMSRITGTGCQLSGLMTAFLAANPLDVLHAAAAAVCMMGLSGEIGWRNLKPGEGNATYRNRIIDAASLMDGDILEKGANYEIW